jgi:hypothetical protein
MTNDLNEALERFNSLPDDAILPSRVTGIILGVSERTIRYHPYLPRVQISRGRYGQRVGDIRKLCRDGMPQEAAYARMSPPRTRGRACP